MDDLTTSQEVPAYEVIAGAAAAATIETTGRKGRKKVSAKQDGAAKDWCFTWNNPENQKPEAFFPEFGYLVYQLERAPDTGTEHIQGFVQFKKPIRLTGLKKVNEAIHWEKRRGTAQEAADYCKKSDSRMLDDEGMPCGPFEFGVLSTVGVRNDLAALAKSVLDGKRLIEVATDDPSCFARYSRGLQALARYAKAPAIDREVEVRLYIGPTRTGKTWSALHEVDPDDVYVKDTDKWWDNYQGQSNVVLDDFSGAASHVPVVELLRLLDNYRLQVPVKGSFEWFHARTIILTTNIHPCKWYEWKGRWEHYDALIARFSEVRIFSVRGEAPICLKDKGHILNFADPTAHGVDRC